ncbi:MAG: tellurium resistance protein TerC [Ardenticatenia bacterium]|nr:MAG: tellurium resistance protein TerC [Ardenticatenia bacterium]
MGEVCWFQRARLKLRTFTPICGASYRLSKDWIAMDTTGIIGVLTVVAQLIFLEGILSIDNAAVLGAMVSVLPDDQPVPYPAWLRFLRAPTSRLLGMQQSAALKVGLLGAYAGRGLMLALASWVIRNPFLKVLGAAYLVRLAFEHLGEREEGVDAGNHAMAHRAAAAFWLVVLNVELADLAFSLDNVVAAVALSNQFWVVMLGVALGILTMRFAAGVFTWLIKREPILATAAYLVVFNIGVELLLDEFLGIHFDSWQKFTISAATLVLCALYARVPFLHRLAPLWHWFARGMGILNDLIVWILQPIWLPLRLLVRYVSGAL